ncbi:hypothetical protein PG994_004541 [Apiospora phragmitis]|uniref:F-box domain-containing protein n=1 Tax=Apiospora phragmitis TaxID=2905665 RepID=A0ABR1VS27_9PEZI
MPRETRPTRIKQHASHSNTFRDHGRFSRPRQKQDFPRRGVFPFFDLPYELRHEILKLAVLPETRHSTTLSRRSPKAYQQALSLFLTCRWLYEEAAPIFYQEVVLDTQASEYADVSGSPTSFLVRSLTPRLYVRTLHFSFNVQEHHFCLFHSVYAPILRDMAQRGRLEHLVLRSGTSSRRPASGAAA